VSLDEFLSIVYFGGNVGEYKPSEESSRGMGAQVPTSIEDYIVDYFVLILMLYIKMSLIQSSLNFKDTIYNFTFGPKVFINAWEIEE